MTRSVRLSLGALAVVLVLAVAGTVWFAGAAYPAMGLAGIPRDGYRQALERVARSRARVDGRTFVAFDSMTFRPADRGEAAFAWGAARCQAADGATVLYWVSLRWNPGRGQWVRGGVRELAPPGNEIYFGRNVPGQILRARLVLRELFAELRARFREAASLQGSVTGLPSLGL